MKRYETQPLITYCDPCPPLGDTESMPTFKYRCVNCNMRWDSFSVDEFKRDRLAFPCHKCAGKVELLGQIGSGLKAEHAHFDEGHPRRQAYREHYHSHRRDARHHWNARSPRNYCRSCEEEIYPEAEYCPCCGASQI